MTTRISQRAEAARHPRSTARPAASRWQQERGWVRWPVPAVVATTQQRTIDLPTYFQQLQLPPRPPIFVEQVHGGRVAVIDAASQHPASMWLPGYDGVVTSLRAVPLAIRTADCVPIFVYDPAHHAGGIAHAGWRGLGAGIVPAMVAAMVEQFQTEPAALQAALGPAIGSCCYEVREPLISQFADAIVRRARRAYLDLDAVVREGLLHAGVRAEAIHDSGWCTACHTDRFFSYRREGPSTGRLVSIFLLQ